MFAGINKFWAWVRLILAWASRRELKWAVKRAQNMFMPKNMNFVAIIITLEGIDKKKKTNKTLFTL